MHFWDKARNNDREPHLDHDYKNKNSSFKKGNPVAIDLRLAFAVLKLKVET